MPDPALTSGSSRSHSTKGRAVTTDTTNTTVDLAVPIGSSLLVQIRTGATVQRVTRVTKVVRRSGVRAAAGPVILHRVLIKKRRHVRC